MKTVDGRYVEVYVEPSLGENYLVVHDGGNAVAELFLQGIHMTEPKLKVLSAIAQSYGASFQNNAFTMAVKAPKVTEAVLAIAQCTSIAMIDSVKHQPVIDDEVIAAAVRRTLTDYRPTEVEMRYRFVARGAHDHVFDAVAFPRVPNRRPVAVKTLGTAYSPKVQSERYGFLALDLKDTEADKWPRLAVIAKAERWHKKDLAVVRNYSTKTLELKTGQDADIERLLRPYIDELAA